MMAKTEKQKAYQLIRDSMCKESRSDLTVKAEEVAMTVDEKA
jgi:hypothetical protein